MYFIEIRKHLINLDQVKCIGTNGAEFIIYFAMDDHLSHKYRTPEEARDIYNQIKAKIDLLQEK